MDSGDTIPRYFLYGETPTDVERSFLHVETIERRSSVNDWSIRPHAHPEHHQILLLSQGSGSVQLEDGMLDLLPCSIVAVPALVVHSYRFQPGSDGMVVTIARSFLQEAMEGEAALERPFTEHGCCVQGLAEQDVELLEAFRALEREFVWSALGRRVAIKANLQRILVTLARLHSPGIQSAGGARRRDMEIVVRFREVLERAFRQQPTLPVFAQALGITPASLNAACRGATGKSALTIVHDRILIESKRHLLYTGMSVGEVAASLGFSDAAYFNRFFSRRTGMTPGQFRAESLRGPARGVVGPPDSDGG